jgi:NarL family two-component system response regulator LiaR
MVLQELGQRAKQPLTPEPLTQREVDIIRLVGQGLSNRQIADQLVIGEATVRTHVGSVLHNLHLANRIQATLHGLPKGLTSLEEMDTSAKKKLLRASLYQPSAARWAVVFSFWVSPP